MSSQQIFVSIELGEKTHKVGKLWFHQRGSRQSASFEYDPDWLKHSEKFALDPAIQLTSGAFHTTPDQILFGAIGDSAPDRWGRVLMRRAESGRAKLAREVPRTLSEADYLLGVNDEARQGALRFSLADGGPYLAPKNKESIPPLISLPKLLSATERYLDDDETAEDLKILLAPGSSLGGARPKASVRDKDGHLAIAKFPKKDDEFNVVVWEAVALTLAEKAGIKTTEWRLEPIMDKPVLLLRRFDRQSAQRVPFLSAMSMLGAKDNDPHSYLDIAYAIMQNGANPNSDLEELWRRIIFSVLISNTDDHLRNHGFLYERNKGWRLSPAYDVNPTPVEIKARMLSTSINYDDPTASIDLALSIIEDFRIKKATALKIIKEVALAVSEWRSVATRLGLIKREIDHMASAFEHEELRKQRW
ncbi:type II toxin-antitoxin system HipA family toxin [Legionella sp. 16cNR16C]|uniref:type II toxin-antitoxin system HipA family toxin n=1 Tax=Legionella sp. 16cNR16C TaxID=2905656 RepID=UPI001E28BCBE|nr:type II toxin-antitoxin system HipA family toxin [Legionella sp. 16cNR16C]MCE3045210.1 type II toxin-antitoxin system HipA family toxin [Legionella sp. 16cNR16C]